MSPRVTRRLITAACLVSGFVLGPALASGVEISVEKLRDHVAFLASDELAGRESGGPGVEVAAEYLARTFAALGLEPAGDEGSYFQQFTVPYGADFGTLLGVTLELENDFERQWAPWIEALPMGFGEAGAVDAPVVFAGYGITTSEEDREKGLSYDDYAGLDVKGKVVVVLRFTPRSGVDDDPFGGRRSPHAPFIAKLSLARKLGAAGIVFVTPPGHPQAGSENKSVENLQGFARQAAPRHPTLPAVLAPTRVVAELLASAGRSLDRIVGEIDAKLEPQSFAFRGVKLRMDTRRGYRVLRNVAARLKGTGELARETIAIGGHYDHIGRYGGQVSPQNFGLIHNGADDNASGVAGLLELARVFAERGPAPGRSLLFLCFSGEEIGLLGSRHWVRAPRRFRVKRSTPLLERPSAQHHSVPPGSGSPPGEGAAPPDSNGAASAEPGTLLSATGEAVAGLLEVRHPRRRGKYWVAESAVEQTTGPEPLHRIAAMVNMDMIGRAKSDIAVSVIASDSSEAFGPLLDALSESEALPVRRSRGLRGGGSDHTHFLRRGIPTLFFFTGMHRQYNTPDDDTERLNFEGMKRIVSLIAASVERLSTMAEAPPFSSRPEVAGRGAHGRPRLGVEVDPGFSQRGARVSGVTEDTPAAGAGLKTGDVIIRFAESRVESFEDLVVAVGDVSPGSAVTVTVLRDGEKVEMKARFPGRSGGFRVSFGSVPDYAFEERGVRFDDIRPGTAAAEAGVKAGDVLVLWGGKEVEDVTHWTGMLGAHKPGDEVRISVRRGKETLELRVKLRRR